MLNYEAERSNKANYFYKQFDENLNFPAHMHHSFEYIYCYEGEIELKIGESTFIIRGGDAAIIFPLQIHSYTTKKHSKSCLFIFSPSYIRMFYKNYESQKPDNPVFKFIEYENVNNMLGNSSMADYSVYLRISCLNFIIAQFVQNTTFSPRDTKTQNISFKIIEYIYSNFNLNPSLNELCITLGYSYNYISSFIKLIFNTNFMQLVNEYRIDHAQSLLVESSDSITQISLKCGYDSLQSFNRNFKKIVGITPTEFKKKLSHHKKSPNIRNIAYSDLFYKRFSVNS